MTEKERMIACRMYDPEAPDCAADRTAAHDLCHRLNNTRPSDAAGREAILRELLPNAQFPLRIDSPFQCQFGYNITIGKGFRAGSGLILTDNTRITFGENVALGTGCIVLTPVHPMSYEKRNTYRIYSLPVSVGDNVKIGSEVKILAGVTVGSNVVIASGSLVLRDIPDNCYATGSPCKPVCGIDEYMDKFREGNA